MGKMLDALLRLQAVERDLTAVRRRLQTRKNAVAIQQRKIDQLRAEYAAIHDKAVSRRKEADRRELDLKQKEAKVSSLRTALNTAKTNKEYAAILTELNTHKADNAKLEEEILKIMQEVDSIKADADKVNAQIEAESKRLQETQRTSEEEINRLTELTDKLTAQRADAAAEVPPEALAAFNRISESYEGEAMAVVEVHGKRPPYDYVCGGCYMSLNAEHANVLRTRDEIRTCDNCRRILYIQPQADKAKVE
ncbi:MAG: zinc ribbon domain-containing protein [Phycisphaerae bacterium]